MSNHSSMYTFYKDVVAKEILVRREVKNHGGHYKMMEKLQMGGVGLGGMRYMGGVPEMDKINTYQDTIVSNFEILRDGFVIRFRNVQFHSMVICKMEAVESIHLEKVPDLISMDGRSLFKSMMNKGIAYETCRVFATPRQLIKMGKIELTIRIDGKDMVFQNLEGFTGKISKYFNRPTFAGKYTEKLELYRMA